MPSALEKNAFNFFPGGTKFFNPLFAVSLYSLYSLWFAVFAVDMLYGGISGWGGKS
jgi:hypothetical protein